MQYLKRFMVGIGHSKITKSLLTNKPPKYVRRAFYGLFEKTPFMAIDESGPIAFGCVPARCADMSI